MAIFPSIYIHAYTVTCKPYLGTFTYTKKNRTGDIVFVNVATTRHSNGKKSSIQLCNHYTAPYRI